MKAIQIIILLILAVLLNACASAARAPMPEADLASKYIYVVEREAQNRATRVYWVHPPSNEDVARKIEGNGG